MLAWSRPTAAQSPPSSVIGDVDPALGAAPIALTVSGGVSLGAYEAGFLYYELEVLKQYPDLLNVKAVSGASAGSLNGLLAIMSYCGQHLPSPHQSIFWKVWIPLGFDKLFNKNQASSMGVLSRDYFEQVAERVREVWAQGLSPTCDVVWGVATTRVFPRSVSMADSRLQLPRIEEKFSMRIKGKGFNKPPRITNYFDWHYGVEQTLLPTNVDQEVSFDSIRDLTFASCSFPLAFTPVSLRYCITSPKQSFMPRCRLENSIAGLFIDGGVLDNSPLRLAARTMGSGLRLQKSGEYGWLDSPQLDHAEIPDKARFLFVTPDAADYPMYDGLGRERVPDSLSGMVKQLLATFVSTARTKELYTLIEERPELRNRIFIPSRHFPTASGLLSAFFGFVERDFRIFDFYLGMYDARRNIDDDIRPRMQARFGDALVEPIYPEEEGMIVPGELQEWLPLQCMRHAFDDIDVLRDACAGPELENFRILLQVSLERVYDNCARLDTRALGKTRNSACLKAARGGEPPHVIGTYWPQDFSWRRLEGESELEYILRLLAAHRFHFKDLGLDKDDAWQAHTAIREMIETLAHTVASKQPLSEREAIRLAGEFAADFVIYAPPPSMVYLTVSRQLELGYSLAPPKYRLFPESLRLNGAMVLAGLGSLITSDPSHFALGPVFGVELEPRRLGGDFTRTRFAARAGYLFSTGDQFLFKRCTDADNDNFHDCSRLMVQAQVGITAFDHIRFQLAFELYPPTRRREQMLWSFSPGIGLQF